MTTATDTCLRNKVGSGREGHPVHGRIDVGNRTGEGNRGAGRAIAGAERQATDRGERKR